MRLVSGTKNIYVTDSGDFYEGDKKLKLTRQPSGTMTANFMRDGRTLDHHAAELVMLTLGTPRPSPSHVIGYLDGHKSNLALTNLCWRLSTLRARAYRRSHFPRRR